MHTPAQPSHSTYPHHPGYLYDCEACEAECHCATGNSQCIWSGHDNEEN